jgi:hypothetical protein
MALTETLTDNFNGPSIDAAVWTAFLFGETQTEGVLVAPSTALATNYSGISSINNFDFTGSYVSSRLVFAGNQSLASWQAECIGIQVDASNKLFWYINGGTLHAQKEVAGAFADVASGTTYNEGVHRYFRIRESGGTFFWDYSTNGVFWTNFTTLANPFASITTVKVVIQAGTFSSEATATKMYVDNLNLFPREMVTPVFRPGATWTRRFAKNERQMIARVTPSGPNAYSQSFTAALAFTGSLVKMTTHPMTAALSFTGNLTKRLTRPLAGVLSFTGAFTKGSLFSKVFTATLSFTGALSKRTSKGLSGVLSFTGALTKRLSRAFTATLSFTGGLTKRLARTFTAALSFTGAFSKGSLFSKAFTATLSFTGDFSTIWHQLPIFTPIRLTVRGFTNLFIDRGQHTTKTEQGSTNVATTEGGVTIEEIDGQIKTDTIQSETNETTL